MTFANASEAIERIWFVARESNLPYTTLDAIEKIRNEVAFADDYAAEKDNLEESLYQAEQKVSKLERKIVQLETANEQLQERIEELESAP